MTKKELARDKYLKKTYKLSLSKYNKKCKEQGGVCEICGRPPKKLPLFVDHDHKCCKKSPTCGKCTRGLLCFICNKKVVGVIEKYKVPADKVAAYLTKYAKKD